MGRGGRGQECGNGQQSEKAHGALFAAVADCPASSSRSRAEGGGVGSIPFLVYKVFGSLLTSAGTCMLEGDARTRAWR